MTDYADYLTKDRRLLILRILRGVHERRANQYVLRAALRDLGFEELVSTVLNDLAYLHKQGLIRTEELPETITLVTLTDLGDQVARGVTRMAGVAVPAVK
jgi:hypothetical protein